MRTFLGMLIVLAASGAMEVVIEGFLGHSVLLPCNCSDRVKNRELRWQKEMFKVFSRINTTSYFHDRYKDRAEVFLDVNSNDCSLLLTNITAADRGRYRYSFYSVTTGYKYGFIDLNVSVFAVQSSKPIQQEFRTPFPKIISIVLLLGSCLVLWCVMSTWNRTCRSVNGTTTEVEAHN